MGNRSEVAFAKKGDIELKPDIYKPEKPPILGQPVLRSGVGEAVTRNLLRDRRERHRGSRDGNDAGGTGGGPIV